MKRIGRESRRRDPVVASRAARLGSRLLLLILAGAFIIKLVVLLQLHDHPLLQPRATLDSGFYFDLGHRVASGDSLNDGRVFFFSPFYIYFLGAVVALSSGSVLAIGIVQILLGCATVWFVAATARRWFGDRGAYIAGGLVALTGYFTFNEILILQSAVDPFLTALGLWLLTEGWFTGRTRWFLATGLVLGAQTLNRPNIAVWAAAVVVITMVASKFRRPAVRSALRSDRPVQTAPPRRSDPLRREDLQRADNGGPQGFGPVLALVAGIAVAIAPAAIRNFVVAHEFAPTSAHGGVNFFIGNNANASGVFQAVPGITPSMAGFMRDTRLVAGRAVGHPVSDVEASSWFYRQGWSWIRGHPGAAIRLFGKKLAFVFNATEAAVNDSFTYYSRDEPTLLRFLFVGPWLLLPLGIAGTWLGRPGVDATPAARRLWPSFVSFIPIYAVSIAIFFVAGRFRLPLLVVLCVFASGATLAIWRAWEARQWPRITGMVLAILVLGALTNLPLGLDDARPIWQAEMIRTYIELRKDDDARALLARAAPTFPNRPLLFYRVGQSFAARGDAAIAVPYFEQALSLSADRPEIHLDLGRALVEAKRPAEAIPHLTAALNAGLRVDLAAPALVGALQASGAPPADAVAALHRIPAPETLDAASQTIVGHLAMQLGDLALAEQMLSRSVVRAPNDAGSHSSLGLTLGQLGRRAEALREFEIATRLDPGNAAIRLNLAVAYAEVGRLPDARREAREALRLQPNYERAKQLLAALGDK